MKDTQELVDLLIDASTDVAQVIKDPKNYVSDTSMLLKLIPEIQAAFDGITNVPTELSAMTQTDAEALVAHIAAKLTVTDAHAQDVINAALKAAVAVYGLVKVLLNKPAVATAAPAAPATA